MHVVSLTFICHCMNFFSLLDLIYMVCYLFRIVYVDTSLFGHVLCNRFQCFTVVCITHKTQMNAKPIERFASICCDFDCPNGHTICKSIYFTILQSIDWHIFTTLCSPVCIVNECISSLYSVWLGKSANILSLEGPCDVLKHMRNIGMKELRASKWIEWMFCGDTIVNKNIH